MIPPISGKAIADAATGRFLRVNDRFCAIAGRGREELLSGLTWRDIIHPDDLPADDTGLGRVHEGGEHRAEKRYLRPDGSILWVELRATRIPGTGRITAAVQDITARREAEARQALLAREVDHRAKNALTVVQAALRLTPREDAATFAAAVEGRVTALARAQTLLAGTHWSGAPLREMIRGELAPFLGPGGEEGPKPRLAGPAVRLAPGAVQPFSMALHELATNAVKYGALSVPGGRLLVDWTADPATDRLRLTWRELGRPAAGAPGRSGFATRVLDATVHAQLRGQVTREWRSSGLVCTIDLPLARATVMAEDPPPDFAAAE